MQTIQVTRSFVAADALAEVIAANYPFDDPVACRLFSKMLRTQDNDHYQVAAGGQKYVARIYQQGDPLGRQQSDYQFELDWLNHLKDHNLPISHPISRRDGGCLGSVNAPEGIRYYALFSFAPGEPMTADDPDQLWVVGQQMAHIHQVSNNFTTPNHRQAMDMEFLVDHSIDRIKRYWNNNVGEQLDILITSGEEAKEEVLSLLNSDQEAADKWGPIGGDFHPVSTHFQDGAPCFFNFDLCGHGWRAYDIAVFLLNTNLLHQDPELGEAFFEGYYSVRPLSANEYEAISPFMTIRRVWLAGTFSVRNRIVGHTFVAPL
jgi:Ser/Thr protein kinase RdoA (MazF antagonist)